MYFIPIYNVREKKSFTLKFHYHEVIHYHGEKQETFKTKKRLLGNSLQIR